MFSVKSDVFSYISFRGHAVAKFFVSQDRANGVFLFSTKSFVRKLTLLLKLARIGQVNSFVKENGMFAFSLDGDKATKTLQNILEKFGRATLSGEYLKNHSNSYSHERISTALCRSTVYIYMGIFYMQYPQNSPYDPQVQTTPPLYENHYMGFYIRVYPDHIEFKNAQGSQVAHLRQITSMQTGMPLFMGITITINGRSQMIPTSKKKEVERAILDAQAQLITLNPQVQPRQLQVPMQSPMQQPMGTPIDVEIQRVKTEIEQRRLHLSQVNANMSNVRAHYQQKHVHGGGKFGSFVRDVQKSTKDAQLKKQQPMKERLQREKLALEQQLSNLKMLKSQGITHITH